MRESDKKSREDAMAVNSFLNRAAMAQYKVFLSLADSKYSGTACLVRHAKIQKPLSIRYNLEDQSTDSNQHDPDGRVIFIRFQSFAILHT